jgi:Ca2+/Na+ antiporter
MSSHDEHPITSRIRERPSFSPSKLRQVDPRSLGYRFIAGAITSVLSGLLAIAVSARVGGIMLAFPAILGASLTLIAREEDTAEAREDARGAVIGGCALALFAGVAALTLGHLSPAVSLLLATAAWFACALGGYLLAWFR